MYKISKSTHLLSLVLIAIGLISTVYAFITDSHAAWTSLIFNNYFFLGISIFAVFFVALQHVAEAGWSTVIKRVPEAIMTFLPYTCAVMIFIVIAAMLHWNHIYHWMEVGIMTEGAPNYDKIIAGKEAYLNPIFFLVRSIIYVVVWIYCAKRLRDISLQGDLEGGIGEKSYNKGITVSAWFIVFLQLVLQLHLGTGLCLLIRTGLVLYLDGIYFLNGLLLALLQYYCFVYFLKNKVIFRILMTV